MAAHASAMAWKLQGADPEASVVAVVGMEHARPAARRHGGTAAGSLHAGRCMRRSCLQSASRVPWRKSRIEIPYLQERYDSFAWR